MNFGKVIAGLSLIAMIAVCGCGMGKETTNKKTLTELTEQQKEILEQEGLPTDIEELSASQKRCIMKIDEMMNYMEETYGEEFVFDGFNEAEILDRWEKIYVYRAVDTDKTSSITVKRKWENGEWVYEDEYLFAYATSYWEELIRGYLKETLKENQFIVECYAGYENDATVENIKKDFKKYSFCNSAYVYIDGGTVSEEEYEKLVKKLKKFGQEQKFGYFSMDLLKKGVIQRRKKEKLSGSEDEYTYASDDDNDYSRHDILVEGW